jgi:tyrosyl-DNA phosphodiesterase 2
VARLRILTWNVWFGGYMFDERGDALIREIERRRPDVVALQEVTPPLRKKITHRTAGYTLHGGDSYFGYDVLLLTRIPVASSQSFELPSDMGRRLLIVGLENGLAVATVHLESTAPYAATRTLQLLTICPTLAGMGDDSVLVGDMNFDDDATQEPAAVDKSFVDVWPALRREPGYTVDSAVNTMRTELVGTARKRIDRVFLRGPRWRATSIELVGTQAIDEADTFVSDHFGLAVELATAD